MTASISKSTQSQLFGPTKRATTSGAVTRLLYHLIPEGYEDSSGFHYGKMPPFVAPDTIGRLQVRRSNQWHTLPAALTA
jgi:hypothetical protein